jgi:hypothetical protein
MIQVEMISSSFHYVDCDVPAGMTIEEYRRRRIRPAHRAGLMAWLLHHLR